MAKLFFIFIYILIFLIPEINNQDVCSKETPIYKSGSCQSIYCDENEFQNGACIIGNSIINTQWLNKLIFFGGEAAISITPI